MGWEEGRGPQPWIMWTGLSCTEEEKAEAREFEEDQVAGRLKEDVVSVEAAVSVVGDGASFQFQFSFLFLLLCSLSREAGYRSRWQRR